VINEALSFKAVVVHRIYAEFGCIGRVQIELYNLRIIEELINWNTRFWAKKSIDSLHGCSYKFTQTDMVTSKNSSKPG
jgi:hypothetical protein